MKQIQEIYRDKPLEDCYKFFTTKEGADILPYSYIQSPLAYDDLIKNCTDYYLFKDEVELIKNNESKLRDYLGDVDSVVEIGPGSESPIINKTLPLLSYIPTLKNYFPLDISSEYLKDASSLVSNAMPRTNVRPIEFDIMQNSIFDLGNLSSCGKKAFVLLGGTLGNFSNHQQNIMLRNIYDMLAPGDIFLITFDTNENEEEIIKAYNNRFLFSILNGSLDYFCARYNNIREHVMKFHPKCQYNAVSRCVNLFFVTDSNIVLHLPHYHTISINKLSEFRGIKSQKYKVDQASLLLEDNNFSIVDILNSTNRMRIFICQKL